MPVDGSKGVSQHDPNRVGSFVYSSAPQRTHDFSYSARDSNQSALPQLVTGLKLEAGAELPEIQLQLGCKGWRPMKKLNSFKEKGQRCRSGRSKLAYASEFGCASQVVFSFSPCALT